MAGADPKSFALVGRKTDAKGKMSPAVKKVLDNQMEDLFKDPTVAHPYLN